MSRTSASKEPVYLEKHAFALDPYLEEPQLLTTTAACVPPNPCKGLRFDTQALASYRVP